jgi:hypothetical protein
MGALVGALSPWVYRRMQHGGRVVVKVSNECKQFAMSKRSRDHDVGGADWLINARLPCRAAMQSAGGTEAHQQITIAAAFS